MSDKNTFWQMVPTGKTRWISVGVIILALLVFLGWKAFWTTDGGDSFALRQQEEKIREMEDRVAKLQRELEESANKLASLQSGSDESVRSSRAPQRRGSNPRREESRPADRNGSREPRLYETVRSTAVFEEPSANSRQVGTIPNGSLVRVVGSTGDWLEVRSKQGRPPGFILSHDAVSAR